MRSDGSDCEGPPLMTRLQTLKPKVNLKKNARVLSDEVRTPHRLQPLARTFNSAFMKKNAVINELQTCKIANRGKPEKKFGAICPFDSSCSTEFNHALNLF